MPPPYSTMVLRSREPRLVAENVRPLNGAVLAWAVIFTESRGFTSSTPSTVTRADAARRSVALVLMVSVSVGLRRKLPFTA